VDVGVRQLVLVAAGSLNLACTPPEGSAELSGSTQVAAAGAVVVGAAGPDGLFVFANEVAPEEEEAGESGTDTGGGPPGEFYDPGLASADAVVAVEGRVHVLSLEGDAELSAHRFSGSGSPKSLGSPTTLGPSGSTGAMAVVGGLSGELAVAVGSSTVYVVDLVSSDDEYSTHGAVTSVVGADEYLGISVYGRDGFLVTRFAEPVDGADYGLTRIHDILGGDAPSLSLTIPLPGAKADKSGPPSRAPAQVVYGTGRAFVLYDGKLATLLLEDASMIGDPIDLAELELPVETMSSVGGAGLFLAGGSNPVQVATLSLGDPEYPSIYGRHEIEAKHAHDLLPTTSALVLLTEQGLTWIPY
jgi:hypothetical protein